MFSALNQGSIIYILDKTDKPKFRVGEVISISQPKPAFNNYSQFNPTTIDLKVNVDGTTYEYNSIPSNLSLVTYNNGKLSISETKQGLQSEVENILQNSRQILENLETYKQNIKECEQILKEINPQFAKDKERDDRLNVLEDKIDKLLTLIDKPL